MATVKILHNPRCSKSRQTLQLVTEQGIEPEVVLYLAEPLGAANIEQLKSYLKVSSVREFMRTKEPEYKALGLHKETNEDALIDAIVKNPKLLERPIVISHSDAGIQARIGRPPENVLEIL